MYSDDYIGIHPALLQLEPTARSASFYRSTVTPGGEVERRLSQRVVGMFFEGGETRAVNASGSDDPSFRSLSAVGMTFLPKGKKAMARKVPRWTGERQFSL